MLQLAFAVVHLGGLLVLLPGRYITGVLVAWCAGALLAMLLVRTVTKDPIPFPVPGPVAEAAAAIRRGFPTYLVGAAFVLLLQVDRMVVGALLGREALGQYGILVLGGSALLFLPGVVAGVLWPYAGEQFGRSGGSREALRPLARATLRGLAFALAAALVLVAQGIEVLVDRKLTNYRPALEALRLYLPGVFLLGLVHPLRLFLVTAGGDRAMLRLTAWMLVVTAVAEGGAAAAGAGIGGVALAGTVARPAARGSSARASSPRPSPATSSSIAWVLPSRRPRVRRCASSSPPSHCLRRAGRSSESGSSFPARRRGEPGPGTRWPRPCAESWAGTRRRPRRGLLPPRRRSAAPPPSSSGAAPTAGGSGRAPTGCAASATGGSPSWTSRGAPSRWPPPTGAGTCRSTGRSSISRRCARGWRRRGSPSPRAPTPRSCCGSSRAAGPRPWRRCGGSSPSRPTTRRSGACSSPGTPSARSRSSPRAATAASSSRAPSTPCSPSATFPGTPTRRRSRSSSRSPTSRPPGPSSARRGSSPRATS